MTAKKPDIARVSFVSLGCPKNLVDSEKMLALLQEGGVKPVNEADRPDAIVVNTCGFLEASKEESLDVIRDAIERVLARQSSNGSFGLWGVGGDDAWLDAYVTDFLTRARERGFAVPDVAFKLALDRLKNVVANAQEPAKDGGRNLAYALYVLAKNGVAPLGDLRYLADAKLGDVSSSIAKAQVAALESQQTGTQSQVSAARSQAEGARASADQAASAYRLRANPYTEDDLKTARAGVAQAEAAVADMSFTRSPGEFRVAEGRIRPGIMA